jgi:hypothetical protein
METLNKLTADDILAKKDEKTFYVERDGETYTVWRDRKPVVCGGIRDAENVVKHHGIRQWEVKTVPYAQRHPLLNML